MWDGFHFQTEYNNGACGITDMQIPVLQRYQLSRATLFPRYDVRVTPNRMRQDKITPALRIGHFGNQIHFKEGLHMQ